MSVAFRRPRGKMIPKLLTVAVLIGLLSQGNGVSYSKVYLQAGGDVPPFQYYNYGAPALPFLGSQVARLTAPPLDSVLPLPQPANFLPPCVAPCIPTQSIAPVTNAGLVAYNSPSFPVYSVTRDEPASYGYSYGVYEDNPPIRSRYTILQPGYNTLIGNYLPEKLQTKETKPNNDEKPAAIKELPQEKSPANPPAETSPQPEHPVSDDKKPANDGPSPATKDELKVAKPDQSQETVTAKVKEEKPSTPVNAVVTPITSAPEISEENRSPSKPDKLEKQEKGFGQPIIVQAPPQGVIIANPPPPISYDTYSQLMRCIQAMKDSDRPNSSLSYVLLPSMRC